MLRGLSTIWRRAVSGSALQFHVQSMTLVFGAIASSAIALVIIWLGLRKQARRPAYELLSGAGEFDLVESGKRNRASRYFWVAFALGIAGGLLLTVGAQRNATSAAGAFFGGGSLLLIAGLSLCSGCIWLLKKSQAAENLSLLGMGVRNVTRRQRRSLTTLGLLASGWFV